MMPIVTIDTFGTLAELEANDADIYAHYFVSLDIVLANRAYFIERRRKTIVLTLSLTDSTQPSEFNTLCINQPEPQLVRQLLALEQHAHGHGQNLPPTPQVLQQKILSDRESKGLSTRRLPTASISPSLLLSLTAKTSWISSDSAASLLLPSTLSCTATSI